MWAFDLGSVAKAAAQSLTTDAWPAFSQVQASTLLLIGQESDRAVDRYVSRMREALPGLAVRMMDGAGHWIHGDLPTEYAATCSAFLRQEIAATQKPALESRREVCGHTPPPLRHSERRSDGSA